MGNEYCSRVDLSEQQIDLHFVKKIQWNYSLVLQHFEGKDERIAHLMQKTGRINFYLPEDYYLALCRSIIGQQVSTKAAQSIYQRLLDAHSCQLVPEHLAQRKVEDLRPLGLSQQKASYLIDLSNHFVRDRQRFYHLETLSDEEVMKSLVEIKGIGNWTAQMFLMFTLGRLDVFAPDDLGLKNAMVRLYGWRKPPDKKKLVRQSEKWAPYKSIACRYLWISLNDSPGK